MLKLYQFFSSWGLPNPSAFAFKVENYLRMSDIPYEIVVENNPAKGPKHKIPFIVDDGKTMGDSSFIIQHLKDKYGDKLDTGLSQQQLAQAHALQCMLEEHLYWTLLYSRWVDPEGFAIIEEAFFSKLKQPMRAILTYFVRRKMSNQVYAQGIGRHSRDEIYQLAKKDIDCLVTSLGEQPFFFGEKPTSFDACAYAFIANFLYTPINLAPQEYAKTHPTLDAYCQRMKAKYYSD